MNTGVSIFCENGAFFLKKKTDFGILSFYKNAILVFILLYKMALNRPYKGLKRAKKGLKGLGSPKKGFPAELK